MLNRTERDISSHLKHIIDAYLPFHALQYLSRFITRPPHYPPPHPRFEYVLRNEKITRDIEYKRADQYRWESHIQLEYKSNTTKNGKWGM